MYFADSMKVDLDIAGNQTARRLGLGWGGKELAPWPRHSALGKTAISPRSSPLGTFREEERLRLRDRNSTLMT